MKRIDLCGVGNGVVDIFVDVTDSQLESFGIECESFGLVDLDAQSALLSQCNAHEHQLVSGGSVANSVIAFAQLGGTAAFTCCLGDDVYGRHYRDEFKELGIALNVPLIPGKHTGTCLIMITPDARRTMRTSLGVAGEIGPQHVDPETVANSHWLFLEGYLLPCGEDGQGAVRKALAAAKEGNTKVALTCSDKFIVEHWGEVVREVIAQTDLLFANEFEAMALTGAPSAEQAFQALLQQVPNVVVTAGPAGAFVRYNGEQGHVDSFPCEPRDLTGAGDMFAGAFLSAVQRGVGGLRAARAACYMAREVITRIGARLHTDTKALFEEALRASTH